MIQANNRVAWLDAARGGGIALVVLGHAIREDMWIQYPIFDYIYRFIYTFHMDLFFFLAGVSFVFFDIKKTNMAYLNSKFRTVLKPWVIYSLLLYFLFAILGKIPFLGSFLSDYSEMTFSYFVTQTLLGTNPYATHLWFLPVLFICQFFALLLNNIFNAYSRGKKVKIYLLVFLSLLLIHTFTVTDIYILDRLKRAIIYFTLGIAFSYFREEVKNNIYSLSFFMLCAGIIALSISVYVSVFYGRRVFNIILRALIGAPCMILACVAFANKIVKSEKITTKFLKNIGKHSFTIYLLHQPFCCAVFGAILMKILPNTIIMYIFSIILCFIVSFVFPWLICRIIKIMKLSKIAKMALNIDSEYSLI